MNFSLKELKVQPFVLVDSKGRIIFSSQGFEKIFFPLPCQTRLIDYVHPEDQRDFQKWLRGLDYNSSVLIKTFRLVDKTGRISLAMIRPEYISDEQIILWFWEDKIFKEADDYWERTLTPAMEAVLSSIQDGVFIVDTEGKLVEINRALSEMLGYHKFELIGLPVGRIFSQEPFEIKKATYRFARIMKYGKVRDIEINLKDREGKVIKANFNGAVIRERGILVGILGVVRWLREEESKARLQNQIEELKQELSQLQEESVVKDEFLSLIGHELRTPLANILGYVEFIQEEELAKDEGKRYIGIVYQESRRLARLVNDILDLSRLEAKKLIYNYVLTELDDILNDAVQAVQAEADKKQIKIIKELHCKNPLWLDPDRIKQTTINLLNNAIKFSPQNSEIKLASTTLNEGALVFVQDWGDGIEPEDLERIFKKFERGKSHKSKAGGVGLGLAIAKMIIEDGHKGKLWAESDGLGKGSTFYFWIPFEEKEI